MASKFKWSLIVAAIAILVTAFDGKSGRVIASFDTPKQFLSIREGVANQETSAPIVIEGRADLKKLRQINGRLPFICRELHGVRNPRLIVESTNERAYTVVFKYGDEQALHLFCHAMKLSLTTQKRSVLALTIRQETDVDIRLSPSNSDVATNVDDLSCEEDGSWLLSAVTVDELARFFERQYRRPVVNMTSIKGRWAVTVSESLAKNWPGERESVRIGKTGLMIRWEKVDTNMTVVGDENLAIVK